MPEGRNAKSHSTEDEIVYNHLIDNGLKLERITPKRSYLNELIEGKENEKQPLLF